MIGGLFRGLVAAFHKFFPERQFYHRSHGEVHFISLSGRTQLIYLTLTLAFLTWVGFTSVNVVFKEQIIAQKERNEYMMSQRYLQRIRELERATETAQSRLIVATEEFNKHIEDLEHRHAELKYVVEHQADLRASYDNILQVHTAKRVVNDASEEGKSRILMLAGDVDDSARQSRFDKVGEDGVEVVTASLSKLFKDSVVQPAMGRSPLDVLEEKVANLKHDQDNLIFEMQESSHRRIAEAENVIRTTGLGLDSVVNEYEEFNGTGGPLIALSESDEALDDDETDGQFAENMYRLKSKLDRMNVLEEAVANMPLDIPLNDHYRITSTFGVRRDPFTGRAAAHHGLDMAGRFGAPIVATAAGVVTYAGRRGAYGNVVEIDHGHGFKTRYGHLRKVLVKKGQHVDFYQQIGELGSTGRSTGPHVHYEVWFDSKIRNPAKFIEAGSYVFQK